MIMPLTGDSSKQYTYTGLNDGQTYWIRVLVGDNAGNVGKSAEDNGGTQIATPSANTPPYNLTVSYASKGTTSITVTARAYDKEDGATGKNLTYTVQTSTNGSSWTNRGTSTGLSGIQVSIQASGLRVFTEYYWRVIVTDTGGFSVSSAIQPVVRTRCNGGGAICSYDICSPMCRLGNAGGCIYWCGLNRSYSILRGQCL